MRIEKISIDKIIPADYNPRQDLQPADEKYKSILKSINEFSLVEPLVWNEKTGHIVGGHQRFKILKSSGYKEVDVSVVNLSLSEEKVLNLALNKVQGEWDFPKLKDLLQDLDTGEININLTGFQDKDIETLINQEHILDIQPDNNPLAPYFIYNPKWSNRRSIKYFSLYSYRHNSHNEGVKYFKSIKKECSVVLINHLSQIVADELNKTFRNLQGFSISHCPKTHSGENKHFATELVKALSDIMGLKYKKIFKDRFFKGSTSPRNFYTRLIVDVEETPDMPLILIDDIISSGTTMESCINALKNKIFIVPLGLIYEDVKG